MDLNQAKIILGENLKLNELGLCPKPQGLSKLITEKKTKIKEA